MSGIEHPKPIRILSVEEYPVFPRSTNGEAGSPDLIAATRLCKRIRLQEQSVCSRPTTLPEAQAGKPTLCQMHAQFLHQFAFAGDANRMRSSFDL
jgi:hypothetical protein